MTKIAKGSKILTISSSVDTTEKKSASLNAKQEYHNVDDIRETILGTPDEILYKEVFLKPSALGSLGSQILLLDPLASGQYYNLNTIWLEYEEGDNSYELDGVLDDAITIYSGNAYTSPNIDTKLLTEAGSKVLRVDGSYPVTDPYGVAIYGLTYSNTMSSSSRVYIGTNSGQNFISGDGTLRIKIWYTVRTFGTEL